MSLSKSLDGVQLTTKTDKQIIFDDRLGRFFETSLDPSASTVDTAVAGVSPARQEVSFSNQMVPTEVLFSRKLSESTTLVANSKDRFPHVEVVSDVLAGDLEATCNNTSNQQPSEKRMESIVEECFFAWNERDMDAVASCFDREKGFYYQDSQYLGTIITKQALIQHFDNQAKLLPAGSTIVLENIAVDPSNGNIAAQWHIKVSSAKIPFTRGCSFYRTNPENGLIVSGFRVSEMIIKPSKQLANALVSSSVPFSDSLLPTRQSTMPRSETKMNRQSTSRSIIEVYFEAWNRRDMDAALDCFVEDCIYQTEDPVFVDVLKGKTTLRQHLEKNAASLPPSCRIVLDSTAVDPISGNIGTVWHLEVNGIAIPNLRGCSMYTTDPSTGLVKSGFDVTEAPVKIPRQLLTPTSLLSFPARLLFGQ